MHHLPGTSSNLVSWIHVQSVAANALVTGHVHDRRLTDLVGICGNLRCAGALWRLRCKALWVLEAAF